jgi:hypothetical protein
MRYAGSWFLNVFISVSLKVSNNISFENKNSIAGYSPFTIWTDICSCTQEFGQNGDPVLQF